jgi:hypothetical protein
VCGSAGPQLAHLDDNARRPHLVYAWSRSEPGTSTTKAARFAVLSSPGLTSSGHRVVAPTCLSDPYCHLEPVAGDSLGNYEFREAEWPNRVGTQIPIACINTVGFLPEPRQPWCETTGRPQRTPRRRHPMSRIPALSTQRHPSPKMTCGVAGKREIRLSMPLMRHGLTSLGAAAASDQEGPDHPASWDRG